MWTARGVERRRSIYQFVREREEEEGESWIKEAEKQKDPSTAKATTSFHLLSEETFLSLFLCGGFLSSSPSFCGVRRVEESSVLVWVRINLLCSSSSVCRAPRRKRGRKKEREQGVAEEKKKKDREREFWSSKDVSSEGFSAAFSFFFFLSSKLPSTATGASAQCQPSPFHRKTLKSFFFRLASLRTSSFVFSRLCEEEVETSWRCGGQVRRADANAEEQHATRKNSPPLFRRMYVHLLLAVFLHQSQTLALHRVVPPRRRSLSLSVFLFLSVRLCFCVRCLCL